MTKFLKIGKIVSSHGLEGKVKIISDTNLKNKIFKVEQKLYLGENHEEQTIFSHQVLGKYDLVAFANKCDFNLITNFIGQDIFVDLASLDLAKNEYLEGELIGAKVWEENDCLGVGKEVLKGKVYNFLVVKGTKQFLIPLVPAYVLTFDRQENKIHVVNAKSLIM